MKRYPLFFLTMLILVLGVTTSALAVTFTTFDPPGAVLTDAFGINDRGQIVGFFQNSSNVEHGFLRDKNGTFTIIDPPSAVFSDPEAINNRGQIVGTFDTPSSEAQAHGFLRDKNGTFTIIDPPGGINTQAEAINNQGQIVGLFHDNVEPGIPIHGFLAVP